MGKYLIKVESMDHDEAMDEQYQRGIECDGFVIMADKGEGATVCMHHVSIDTISNMIVHESKVMQAAILADAKRQIMAMAAKDEAGKKVEALKALFDGLR